MADNSPSGSVPDLKAVVEHCLPRLKIISAVLDIYDGTDNAAALREIITDLKRALPDLVEQGRATDFIVNATFRVTREQVASLLFCGFKGRPRQWWKIDAVTEPPAFNFRAHSNLILRQLDCPLNEGGWLELSTGTESEALRLDLASIANGLNVMASKSPRHFVDFLNDNADGITGDAFLQCCLLGEVIHE